MKTIPHSAGLSIAALCSVLTLILSGVLIIPCASLMAQQSDDADKKLKNRNLSWNPPNVDSPIRSANTSPPCVLADVLEKAGARTNELTTDLQNFTAQEKIAYRTSDREGFVMDSGSETFDYVVVFQRVQGTPVVEESRKPARGDSVSSIAGGERGLAEIVLMFLPNMQSDYEMKCEGGADWKGQRTWVVHFQQRRDKPARTSSFTDSGAVYPIKLKGHAWISVDSGEVVHLEAGLMEEIPVTKVHQWYVAMDYLPVKFPTHDVTIWLPQMADSYYDFGDHRTVVFHTFTNFILFWTDTDLKIGKPKDH